VKKEWNRRYKETFVLCFSNTT